MIWLQKIKVTKRFTLIEVPLNFMFEFIANFDLMFNKIKFVFALKLDGIKGDLLLRTCASVEDVVKELIQNEIIVDSVIISTKEECKMLCAVCHANGGHYFRSKTVNEGLALL